MKSLFTIRSKKHAVHPQIVVGADKTKFKSVTLTHNENENKHSNVPLDDNPNENDERPSYFARRIIQDFKFNYTKPKPSSSGYLKISIIAIIISCMILFA